jgi:hypothetical protein
VEDRVLVEVVVGRVGAPLALLTMISVVGGEAYKVVAAAVARLAVGLGLHFLEGCWRVAGGVGERIEEDRREDGPSDSLSLGKPAPKVIEWLIDAMAGDGEVGAA